MTILLQNLATSSFIALNTWEWDEYSIQKNIKNEKKALEPICSLSYK